MVAREYIGAMVYANKIIYIDTASLMDVEELNRFIRNSEDIFLKERRRIVVPKAVCLELVRHLGSGNPEKQEKAMRALETIREHQDIFNVQNKDLSEDEIDHAFADAEILAELTRNKKICGQLLITNDKDLSTDAYSLNNQGSCQGYRIMVFFINKFGELRKCECAFTSTAEKTKRTKPVLTPEENNTANQIHVNDGKRPLDESKEDTPSKSDNNLSVRDFLIPVGTYFLGFLTCKYGKTVFNTITSLI